MKKFLKQIIDDIRYTQLGLLMFLCVVASVSGILVLITLIRYFLVNGFPDFN